MIRVGHLDAGLIVDGVQDVVIVEPDGLRPPSGPLAQPQAVAALGAIEGEVLQLIDAERFLSPAQWERVRSAAASEGLATLSLPKTLGLPTRRARLHWRAERPTRAASHARKCLQPEVAWRAIRGLEGGHMGHRISTGWHCAQHELDRCRYLRRIDAHSRGDKRGRCPQSASVAAERFA